MSLAVAVPLGIASSLVYGSTIVVQHRASHNEGQEDARDLLRLLRDPMWVAAVLGDFLGFVLNAAALAAGPVVVIQPLVVLMLPVALIVGWWLGGPRPTAMDYLGSLAIVAGLSGFLIMIGTPGAGHAPKARYFALTVLIVLAVGSAVALAVRSRGAVVRGAVYGAVAGMFFGTLGVFVDGLSDVVVRRGWAALVTTGRGVIPLIGIALLGVSGIVLTQMSFQIGQLAATLPANWRPTRSSPCSSARCCCASTSRSPPGHVIGYALCLAAVVPGAIRLRAINTAAATARARRPRPTNRAAETMAA